MKKIIGIAVLSILSVFDILAQDVVFRAIKNQNGTIVYTAPDGSMLTKDVWIEKYGRPRFKEVYGSGNNITSVSDCGFFRDFVGETVKVVRPGDMQWSRVVETDMSIEDMKRAARSKLDHINHEGENEITGIVDEREWPTTRDMLDFPPRFKNSAFKTNVTYQFKEGRYRVVAHNLRYRITLQLSIYGSGVGVSGEGQAENIYYLLYNKNGKLKVSDAMYAKCVDIIDYALCSTLILSAEQSPEDDW